MPSSIKMNQLNNNTFFRPVINKVNTTIKQVVNDIHNVEVEEYSDFETETVDLNDQITVQLQSLGLTSVDINRIVSGEITYEDLLTEIQNDPDKTRMHKLVEASLLSEQEYNTIDDIDLAVETLKTEIEKLEIEAKTSAENSAILSVLALMKNQNMTLDQALNQVTSANTTDYTLVGDNGYLLNDSISYREILKGSEKLETLKQFLTHNEAIEGVFLGIGGSSESYTYNDSNQLNDFYNQISSSFNSTKNNNFRTQIVENNHKVKELEALKDYIDNESTNYVDNVLSYTLKDDFTENCGTNEKISNVLNSIIENATPDANSPGNYLDYYAVSTEAKMAIIAGLINDDPLVTGSSGTSVGGVPISANVDDVFNHYRQWYQVMTDEEKAVFNYVYNTEGAEGAYKYLESESLQQSLDVRYYQQISENNANWAAEHPVEASLLSVAITPAEGLGSMINSNLANLTGKKVLRTDNYSVGTTYRGGVSQMVGENYGEGAKFAYDIGMSMADTAVVAVPTVLSGGALSGVAMGSLTFSNMGTRIYVSSLNDALDRGLTDQQAITEAWIYTVAETAMESISLGNLAKISSRMNSKVLSLASKAESSIANPKNAKYASRAITIFGSGLSQATVEGEEELATSIVDFFADNIIAGDNSAFYQTIDDYISQGMSEDEAIAKAIQDTASDWAMSFAGGAISGGIFGGGGATFAIARNSHTNNFNNNPRINIQPTITELSQNTQATAGQFTSAIETSQVSNEPTTINDNYIKSSANFVANSFFANHSESTEYFGVDQGSIKTLSRRGSEFKKLRQKLRNMGFSRLDSKRILTQMIDVNEGVCSYAAVANEIFDQYKSNPEKFEEAFGYPMYIEETTRLNETELLLDIFMTVNDKNFVVGAGSQEGGKLFDGTTILAKKGQKYFSRLYAGKDTSLINAFLRTKNQDLSYNSFNLGSRSVYEIYDYTRNNAAFNRYTGQALAGEYFDGHTGELLPYDTESLKKEMITAMKSGDSITLDIFTPPSSERELNTKLAQGKISQEQYNYQIQYARYSDKFQHITMKSINPSKYSDISTETWDEGAGHTVFVTAINDNGVVVSSWGRPYLIEWSQLEQSQFGVTSSRITEFGEENGYFVHNRISDLANSNGQVSYLADFYSGVQTAYVSNSKASIIDSVKSLLSDETGSFSFFKKKDEGSNITLNGLQGKIQLRNAVRSLSQFKDGVVGPNITYETLYKLIQAAQSEDCYRFLTTLGSRYKKTLSNPAWAERIKSTITDMAYQYSGAFIKNEQTGMYNGVQTDRNEQPIFYHFTSDPTFEQTISGRLYLNTWDYSNAYYFSETFIAECQKRGIDFHLKVGAVDENTNFDTDFKARRDESIVIYVNQDNILDCINLCKEIKETMSENAFDSPPVLTSTIDGFIGYGDESLDSSVSFNRNRSNWLTDSYNDIVTQYRQDGIEPNIQNQEFLNNFYKKLLENAENYNIDKNNISLRLITDNIFNEIQDLLDEGTYNKAQLQQIYDELLDKDPDLVKAFEGIKNKFSKSQANGEYQGHNLEWYIKAIISTMQTNHNYNAITSSENDARNIFAKYSQEDIRIMFDLYNAIHTDQTINLSLDTNVYSAFDALESFGRNRADISEGYTSQILDALLNTPQNQRETFIEKYVTRDARAVFKQYSPEQLKQMYEQYISRTITYNTASSDASVFTNSDLTQTIKDAVNVTDDTIPDGYSSVEEYKRDFVRQMVDNGILDDMETPIFMQMVGDSTMLDELVGSSRLNVLMIKNISKNPKAVAKILSKLSQEKLNIMLNEPAVADKIKAIDKNSFLTFITNLNDNSNNNLLENETISEIIVNSDYSDFIKTLTRLDASKSNWLSNDQITNKIVNMSVEEFYTLVNDYYHWYNIIDQIGEGSEKIDQNYLKLISSIRSKFGTLDNLTANLQHLNKISSIVPAYSTIENTSIKAEQQIINDRLKELKTNIKNAIQASFEIEIAIDNYGGLYIDKKGDNSPKYYNLTYEIDGIEYTKSIQEYSASDKLNIDLTSDPEICKAALNGVLKVKSLTVDTVKTTLSQADKTFDKGLHLITALIDGVQQQVLIKCNSDGDRINLNWQFKDAKTAEILSVESLGSFDVVVEDNESMYQLTYEIHGETRNVYLLPEKANRYDKSSPYVIKLDEYFQTMGVEASKIENIQVKSIDQETIKQNFPTIEQFDSKNEIFENSHYGGNQSDVETMVEKYVIDQYLLDNKADTYGGSLSEIETKKSKLLISLIDKYYPGATDIEKVNLAKAYASQGCYYMAISNAFITFMNGQENGQKLFEQNFGFPISYESEGTTSYNLEAVAFDMFLSRVKVCDNLSINEAISKGGLGLNQVTVSHYFPTYFSNYGIKFNSEMHHSNNEEYYKQELLANAMSNKNSFLVLNANNFDLLQLDSDSISDIKDAALANSKTEGKIQKDIGGHAMLITGISDDLELIVSSWARKYKFISDSVVQNKKASGSVVSLNFSLINKEGD